MKTRLFGVLLILALALVPHTVQAQAKAVELSVPADVQRVTTVEIFPYDPFQTSTAHIQEAYSGAMGTLFIFDVGGFGVDHISNLVYTANDGVTCQHNADLIITCTGALSYVTIDFDFTDIANDYLGAYIWAGYTGYSNYDLEYTYNLIYPGPLTYTAYYSLAPVSVTETQITWHLERTRSLPGIALFFDPRVQVIYLPTIMR